MKNMVFSFLTGSAASMASSATKACVLPFQSECVLPLPESVPLYMLALPLCIKAVLFLLLINLYSFRFSFFSCFMFVNFAGHVSCKERHLDSIPDVPVDYSVSCTAQ